MAKKVQHLIDIIIPAHNRKSLLQRAVHSVYSQSYKSWRLFIVDDGSTDGACAQDYGDKAHFLRLEENKGVSFARNYGIQKGQAEWVAFLDSDDEWLADKLEKQVEALSHRPDIPLIHCNEIWMRKGRRLNQKKHHKKHGGRIFSFCADLCCVSPSAAIVKRSAFGELGLFREDFPVCEDYEFWLRLSSRYEALFLDEALVVKHGGHSGQLSRRYKAMDYWRVLALLPFLEDKNLSVGEREKVRRTIIKKSEILLKGYKKHNNFKNQKEIEGIYRKLKGAGD